MSPRRLKCSTFAVSDENPPSDSPSAFTWRLARGFFSNDNYRVYGTETGLPVKSIGRIHWGEDVY